MGDDQTVRAVDEALGPCIGMEDASGSVQQQDPMRKRIQNAQRRPRQQIGVRQPAAQFDATLQMRHQRMSHFNIRRVEGRG